MTALTVTMVDILLMGAREPRAMMSPPAVVAY